MSQKRSRTKCDCQSRSAKQPKPKGLPDCYRATKPLTTRKTRTLVLKKGYDRVMQMIGDAVQLVVIDKKHNIATLALSTDIGLYRLATVKRNDFLDILRRSRDSTFDRLIGVMANSISLCKQKPRIVHESVVLGLVGDWRDWTFSK